MSKFSNWSRENLEKFAQEATDKMMGQMTDPTAAHNETLDELRSALLKCARMVEALKKECGIDPESKQAMINQSYMNISYVARAAIAKAGEKP